MEAKTGIPLNKQKPCHYIYGKLNTNQFVQSLATQGITDAKVDILMKFSSSKLYSNFRIFFQFFNFLSIILQNVLNILLFKKINVSLNEFVSFLKVETGPNGGYPVQIHLPAEEILIQVLKTVHSTQYAQGTQYVHMVRSTPYALGT